MSTPELELVDVDLRCQDCDGFESRLVAGDEQLGDILEALVCQHCGARGRFALAPAILEEARELPPRPEEPE